MPDRGRRNRGVQRSSASAAPAVGDSDGAPDSPTGCSGWLWWRADRDGREKPKEDYLNDRKVPKAVRAEFDKMRERYKTGELRNGANIKFIGDGIYEFRYSHTGNTPFRFLFMRWGKWAIGLDVFKKTTNETPKALALKRRKAWLQEFGKEPPS